MQLLPFRRLAAGVLALLFLTPVAQATDVPGPWFPTPSTSWQSFRTTGVSLPRLTKATDWPDRLSVTDYEGWCIRSDSLPTSPLASSGEGPPGFTLSSDRSDKGVRLDWTAGATTIGGWMFRYRPYLCPGSDEDPSAPRTAALCLEVHRTTAIVARYRLHAVGRAACPDIRGAPESPAPEFPKQPRTVILPDTPSEDPNSGDPNPEGTDPPPGGTPPPPSGQLNVHASSDLPSVIVGEQFVLRADPAPGQPADDFGAGPDQTYGFYWSVDPPFDFTTTGRLLTVTAPQVLGQYNFAVTVAFSPGYTTASSTVAVRVIPTAADALRDREAQVLDEAIARLLPQTVEDHVRQPELVIAPRVRLAPADASGPATFADGGVGSDGSEHFSVGVEHPILDRHAAGLVAAWSRREREAHGERQHARWTTLHPYVLYRGVYGSLWGSVGGGKGELRSSLRTRRETTLRTVSFGVDLPILEAFHAEGVYTASWWRVEHHARRYRAERARAGLRYAPALPSARSARPTLAASLHRARGAGGSRTGVETSAGVAWWYDQRSGTVEFAFTREGGRSVREARFRVLAEEGGEGPAASLVRQEDAQTVWEAAWGIPHRQVLWTPWVEQGGASWGVRKARRGASCVSGVRCEGGGCAGVLVTLRCDA